MRFTAFVLNCVSFSRRFLISAVILGLVVAFQMQGVCFADGPAGRAIYLQKCARCHGKAGEGAKAYPKALVGNRSLKQLTRYIDRSMPENAPKSCTGAEAAKVASYIFDAFYSPAAQSRSRALRIRLAHLTVSEYRNAVTDLIGTISAGNRGGPGKSANGKHGLRGQYFTSTGRRRGRGNRKPVISRIDPVIHLDLGKGTKDFAKIKTGPFSATWRGSVVALDTGMYDFIVRTEHSTQLWVNDMKKPLIDARVKSGSDTVFRGSVFLLGGRTYPVRLEMSRRTLGVRKDRKKPPPPVKTTISLEWKPPFRSVEVIPARNLKPVNADTLYVPPISLPPDDRSAGYVRGNAISKEWVQATTDGAIEAANYVFANLAALSGVRKDAANRKDKLRKYCLRFAERAFRGPLTPQEKRLYVDQQFDAVKDPERAVKRVVLLVLLSPRFLYREPGAGGDAFDVASRLSFSLWDSLPDQKLIEAAAKGQLKTRAQVIRQAQRMIDDPRAHRKMQRFFFQWLRLDQVSELPKDPKKFASFNGNVVSDLRTSLELFLEDAMWSKQSDFRQLLLADYLYLNGRLSKLYGGNLPADAPFRKVSVGKRAGVLTHPYLLAKYSYTATSSPIHRGVFLARNVLGVTLRPPPDAFTPLAPELHPNLNTRERIALQTSPKNCMSCHKVINNLGFTLEHYDAIGRFRQKEKGKSVDASGFYVTRSGKKVKFRNEHEMARFLASSDEVAEAFTARLFHYLVQQPIVAYGPDKLAKLRQSFVDNHYNMRRLVVEIAAEAALPARAKHRP